MPTFFFKKKNSKLGFFFLSFIFLTFVQTHVEGGFKIVFFFQLVLFCGAYRTLQEGLCFRAPNIKTGDIQYRRCILRLHSCFLWFVTFLIHQLETHTGNAKNIYIIVFVFVIDMLTNEKQNASKF